MIPKYFTDTELQELEFNAEYQSRGKKCPICNDTKEYRYQGQAFECPDDDYGHPTLRLAKLYWLSGIPLQYQLLLWPEFPAGEAKTELDSYIEYFDRLRITGAGITIYGEQLGVGKTWAATHILKELTKQGYKGWFASFLDIRGYFELTDKPKKEFLINKIRDTELLVLDEVREPWTEKMRNFYEDQLESLLRYRTNINFPTIVTSNMTPEKFNDCLPRVYSLLSAKNSELELGGKDARKEDLVVWESNNILARRGETRPLK